MAIRVLSITGYKADDSTKLFHEQFHFLSFTRNQFLMMWREDLERWYGDIYGFPVKIYVNRRQKPEKEIDMMSILLNTCNVMGHDVKDVLSGSRKREYVEIKQTAVMILFDADYEAMEIERQLPFKNRVVYDYRVKMENRFQFEPGYQDKYEDRKKKVMDLTFKKDEGQT